MTGNAATRMCPKCRDHLDPNEDFAPGSEVCRMCAKAQSPAAGPAWCKCPDDVYPHLVIEHYAAGSRCCICAPAQCSGQDESGEHGCVHALGAADGCCVVAE